MIVWPTNFSFKAKQTNLTRNQHYHISNSHLHHADTVAMPARCQQGDGHRHTTGGARPWPEESVCGDGGGATVGKLQSCRHDTVYASELHWLGSCFSLLAQSPHHSLEMKLCEVTGSGRCVSVRDCVSCFYSFIQFFLSVIINLIIMNSVEMLHHLFGCKVSYLDESQWGLDHF